MKVTFFGHNCFLLKGKHVNVLSDPWLSDGGAFFGSWFQWPINHHCMPHLLNEIKGNEPTFLYISHEHQDHFCKETLTAIRPHIAACIIPKYHDGFLKRELTSLGYKVIQLEDCEKHYFSDDDYIELMIVDTGVNHDSAAITRIDERTFVNQNDCKIFDRLNYLEGTQVDYYAVQFSGATWHPVCYAMEEAEKKKVLAKFAAVRNAINLVQPKYYLPSAGPAVFPFLDTSLSRGKENIFVHQPDIVGFLANSKTQVVCMRPGEEFENSLHNAAISPPTTDELKNLRQSLRCNFLGYSDDELNVDALRKQISRRLEQIDDLEFPKCPLLIFKWGERGLKVDLNEGFVADILIEDYDWNTEFTCVESSPAYFSLMASPNYRWQDIYLCLRATVHRNPDVFNTFINVFLFSDVSNIRAGFETTLNINDERIVVVNPHNGKKFEINRFCPHNGADLSDAKIDEHDNLICPRHSWLFDLERNGKCKIAEASIEAKEIKDTITLRETIGARLSKKEG